MTPEVYTFYVRVCFFDVHGSAGNHWPLVFYTFHVFYTPKLFDQKKHDFVFAGAFPPQAAFGAKK